MLFLRGGTARDAAANMNVEAKQHKTKPGAEKSTERDFDGSKPFHVVFQLFGFCILT